MRTISSGSMKSISESGVYYVTNAVADKPESSGGLFVLIKANTTTGTGIYIPNTAFSTSYKVAIVNSTWSYYAL